MIYNQGDPKRRKADSTGSPDPGEPVFLAVGKLRRSHGVEGEILMDILTDFPERLRPKKRVYIGEDHIPHVIKWIRNANKHLLVTLDGVNTPEDANRFRNLLMYVRMDQLLPLPEGEYYHHQLLNLQVEDIAGNILGVLVDILKTGANDVYVVKSSNDTELLLPAIESVVKEIDLTHNRMVVDPPEWW